MSSLEWALGMSQQAGILGSSQYHSRILVESNPHPTVRHREFTQANQLAVVTCSPHQGPTN